ncbi:putative set and mynd domain [Phaeomoniella chlamydospora]|uniref:Putative set and mynd domain n=1 Tax=Phaeomoniella chlamydospora TaxID=158046 RepID=A0A0G2GNE8_PHACM|nr:putative set and mynd domain [Phaeomoniella chlamydospora]
MYLMARAAKEYSGTHVTVEYVLSLLARIMINSFTLVTPTFDPIGIILHPLPSMMNHSCDYNAYVRCHKNGAMDVVAIKPISQAEEVRISYIDSTFPTRIRQKELKDNYFFDCKCSKCQDTNNCDFSPDILTNDKISEVLAIESRINDILKSSNYTDTSSFLRKLENAFHVLHSHGNWPLHQQPFPQVRHSYIVSLIASKQFTTAFAQASIQRSRIDPKIYPQDIHPLRTVHDLVLLKLIDLVSEAAEGESPPQTRTDLRRYEFDYVALRIGLLDVLTNRNPSGDQGHSELKEMIDEAEKSVTLDVRQRVTETAIAAQWQKVERLNEDELEREKGFRYVV